MSTNMMIDGRAYNPARDLAKVWAKLFKPAAEWMLQGKGVGGEFLKESNLPEEVVSEGLAAFKKVMDAIQKPEPDVRFQQVVEDSGIMRQDKRLLLALFACLGAKLIGATYGATNDLLNHDEPPLTDRQYATLIAETLGNVI